MKRAQFLVGRSDGNHFLVNGYLPFKHIGLYHDKPNPHWCVVHLPSGLVVAEVPKRAIAEEAARIVAPGLPETGEFGANPPITDALVGTGRALIKYLNSQGIHKRTRY